MVSRTTALWIIGLIILFSCHKRTEQSKDLLSAIQETGQLITAEYTVRKVVKAADEQTWFKLGNRRILLTCEAHLKAGINLQGVTKADITTKDSTIRLVLPKATLFSISIPPDKIQMHYEETGLLRSSFSASEREMLLKQAEVQIRRLADSIGILNKAEVNAITFMKGFLRQGGYTDIQVRFK
jgi:hypothetical protein